MSLMKYLRTEKTEEEEDEEKKARNHFLMDDCI